MGSFLCHLIIIPDKDKSRASVAEKIHIPQLLITESRLRSHDFQVLCDGNIVATIKKARDQRTGSLHVEEITVEARGSVSEITYRHTI